MSSGGKKTPVVIGIECGRKRGASPGRGPEPPEGSPVSGCRPALYVLADHRANVIAAVRRGRHYRSIAAQYGVSALHVWQMVAEELGERRAA